MEHLRSMGPINTRIWKSAQFYTAFQTYQLNFLWDIFLTPNLSWETFGTFCIAIMTDKEITKRLQNILLWCLKNKKMLTFFSDWHRFFLLTDNTIAHKYNIHNHIARDYAGE